MIFRLSALLLTLGCAVFATPASRTCTADEPSVIMTGRFTGVGVTFFVDRDLVQSWLPRGLVVADDCPFEKHPMVILYGTQRELARHKRTTWYPRYGDYYLETFVAIPYLRIRNSRIDEHVFHFVRVYLNSRGATNQGIRLFGWPKIFSEIAKGGGRYQIERTNGGRLFNAWTDYSELEPPDPANQSLAEIREMFSQTLVLKYEGKFDRYSFDLNLDGAVIRSVPATVQVHRGFMPNWGAIRHESPGVNHAEFGSFRIDCRFRKAPK